MIFMGAESIAGNAPLTVAAREDLAEIEKIGGGGQYGLDIFVQVNDRQGAVRHHYGAAPDGADQHSEQSFAPEQLEYRGGRALSDFIETSLAGVGHRRRDNSMLILWGHAYEFAFGRSL